MVVGAGPNGLAAAVTLAEAGLRVTVLEAADSIGGGMRTAELTLPGVRHDVCSAAHPLAAGSPYFAGLPLAEHGLEWKRAPLDLAHPLDGGHAATMVRSIDETAAGLGVDGRAWKRIFGPAARRFTPLADDLMRPILHVPRHPLDLARFGVPALLPATVLARSFRTEPARALYAGCAAHLITPLTQPASASVGMMLISAGHHAGWPVAAGGSQAIGDALAGYLTSLGGVIETGRRVGALADLPEHDVALFDTSPTDLVAIAGDRLPARIRQSYRRWRYGPAAFKLDLAVEDGVPWHAEQCRRAGVVHVGGSLEEIVASEAAVARGRLPQRPFVLVGQQYLADPSRSAGNVHPVWAYAHVPKGYAQDVSELVIDQIERFAPGVRDRIVGRHTTTPEQLQAYNPNYVGGDIATGANSGRQLLFRPRLALDPYATGIPGVYLCSAATPPGAGVHGMCGHHAARSALRQLERGSAA